MHWPEDKRGWRTTQTNDEAQRERTAHWGTGETRELSPEEAEAFRIREEKYQRQQVVDKKRAEAKRSGHLLGYEKKCQCGVECRSAKEWYAHVDAL